MYPTSLEISARQERYKDLLRNADQARLIREAGLEPPGLWETAGKFVRRAGAMRPIWRLNSRASGFVATVCSGQCC